MCWLLRLDQNLSGNGNGKTKLERAEMAEKKYSGVFVSIGYMILLKTAIRGDVRKNKG